MTRVSVCESESTRSSHFDRVNNVAKQIVLTKLRNLFMLLFENKASSLKASDDALLFYC